MSDRTATPEAARREQLGFAHAAARAFGFVLDDGFRLVEESPTLVRFARGGLELHVHHGRQSYEIGTELARDGQRFGLGQIIRIADDEAGRDYRYPVATTPEGVAEALGESATLLRTHGARLLADDPAAFDALARARQRWSEEFALDVRERQVRPRAEEAFRAGAYDVAARLYGDIESRLSAAESKKLRIARERSGSARS